MNSTCIYLNTGGLQIGGGINDQNAKEWLDAGASKVWKYQAASRIMTETLQVIVTSYLFPDTKFSLERLKKISAVVGKEKLVVDVR